MRQFLLRLTLLCFVMALLPAAVALPAAAQSEVVADEELVIINSDDRIVVRDPYTPPGYAPLTWESPQTGYRQVATGDFNSDGTDEIVGLRGGEAQVFDPYRQPNEPDVARVFTASPGQVWSLVATGKYYLNRGDCIVLQQGSPGTAGRLYAYCYIPPTGWSQVYAQDLGAGFLSFASAWRRSRPVNGFSGWTTTAIESWAIACVRTEIGSFGSGRAVNHINQPT